MSRLIEQLGILTEYLRLLERNRYSSPIANDAYEAVAYWCVLGNWVATGNTKVNYPARVTEEQQLLELLETHFDSLASNERDIYSSIFAVGRTVLMEIAKTEVPEDGHLGVLRVISSNFGFLEGIYGLSVMVREPTYMKYSSGLVWINLSYAERSSLCCTFGQDSADGSTFWTEDLLFMYSDLRYQEVQADGEFRDIAELSDWFKFLASVWRTYGRDVLTNAPGVFERLSVARKRRGDGGQQCIP
jgi:hypothetical protein